MAESLFGKVRNAFRLNLWLLAMRWHLPAERRPYAGGLYVAMTAGGIVASYLTAMVVDVEREKGRRQQWMATVKRGRSPAPTSTNSLVNWWRSRRESERTIWALMVANGAVFVGWRIPGLHGFMARYFVHSTRSHPLTMATSLFSHVGGVHLLVNMVALYSFGRILHEHMGREQFLAFYLSCGLMSSAGSHLVRSYRQDFTRSLGASGAIFGVAAGCAHNPDLRVSLIFIPFLSAPISVALPAMMAYDVVGLFRRWATFDHAAHLSGAVFGYVAYTASVRHLWPRRHRILQSLGYSLK